MRPISNPVDISGAPNLSPVLSIVYTAVLLFRHPAGKGQAVGDSNILALGSLAASSLATLYYECLD